jgi:hypothetical protein
LAALLDADGVAVHFLNDVLHAREARMRFSPPGKGAAFGREL